MGTRRSYPWRLALGLLAVTLVPWPAVAGETPAPARRSLRAALANVRPADITPSLAVAARRADRTQSTPATDSPRFFKTRTGVVVLAAVAVGAGYAIYSTRHDRIKSPGKE